MQYDHEPRSGGGGGAGLLILVIGGGVALLLLLIVGGGVLMFWRAKSENAARLDAEMRMMRKAEAERAAQMRAAEFLEEEWAQDHAGAVGSAGSAGSAGDPGDAPARIAELERQLAEQRSITEVLQQRFDRRVKDDEEMFDTLRRQLDMTRARLEEAERKLREK